VKRRARVLVVLGVVALVLFLASRIIPFRLFTASDDAQRDGSGLLGASLPTLADAAGWLNGDRSVADSLRGHPTVVALWSDTDPECLGALAVLQSWYQAYGRYGARIVGVHEPDFAFAADSSVPARLALRMGLSFPIALDPAYAIRERFGAPMVGPQLVLADSTGTIVGLAAGRGALAVIERSLRAQLRQLHPELEFPADPGLASGSSPAPPTEATGAREVALGSTRVSEGPLAGATLGRPALFTAQFRYQVEGKPYVPYPVGLWSPGAEGLTAGRGGAENFVALRYDAGALWAVLSPPPGETARLWVLRDENWLPADALGADARLDSRGASYVEVDESRLYAVCRERAGEHVVKLSPDAPGVIVHALIVDPADARGSREH
jgi:hypothetical protein